LEVEVQSIALPWIEEGDYPAFRALTGDLPPVYKDWLDRRGTIAAYVQVRGGAPEVSITPEEFRWYLCRIGRTASERELWVLATLLSHGVNRGLAGTKPNQTDG
jgi:hypothetical protein